MANDSESIGGLNIDLGLNMDTLVADVDRAAQIAAAGGQTIAQAMSAAFAAGAQSTREAVAQIIASAGSIDTAAQESAAHMASLTSQIDSTVKSMQGYGSGADAIREAQASANQALMESQATLAQIQASYDAGGASANELARAAQQLQTAFNAANPALEKSGESANIAKEAFGGLKEVLGLLGVTLSLEGLKSFAESIAEAADKITTARIALTALTGDAEQAAGMLEKLDQLGISDGLSMPSLYQASQNLTSMLAPGTDVVGVLSQIADASAISGRGIEATSASIERLTNATSLSPKALQGVKLTLNDIQGAFETLGLAADTSWASLDPHDRLVVIQEALLKFQGVAEEVAKNTFGGAWKSAMAQWDADIGIIQKDLGNIVGDLGGSLKSGVNFFAEALVATATVIISTIHEIRGEFQALAIELQGVGNAAALAATGNWTAAGAVIGAAFASAGEVAKQTEEKVTADWAMATKIITDLESQKAASIKPTIDALDGEGNTVVGVTDKINVLATTTHAFYDSMGQVGDAALVADARIAGLTQKVTDLEHSTAVAAANLLNTQKSLAEVFQKYQEGTASLGDLEIAQNRVVAASDNLAKVQKELATTQGELDKAWDTGHTAAAAMNEALSQLGGEMLTAEDNLRDMGLLVNDLPPKMDAANAALIAYGNNAESMGQKVHTLKGDLDTLIANIPGLSQAFDQGRLSSQQFAADLEKDASLIGKMAKDDLPGAIAEWQKFIDAIGKTDLPNKIQLIQQAMSAMMQDQIKWGELTGQSVQGVILSYEKLALAQQNLKISADGWAPAVVAAVKDVQAAFGQMSTAMANAIVDSKNLGDAILGVFSGLGKKLLAEFIDAGLKPAMAEANKVIGDLLGSLSKSSSGGAGGILGGLFSGLSDSAMGAKSSLDKLSPALIDWGNASMNAAGDTKAFGSSVASSGGLLSGSLAKAVDGIGLVAVAMGTLQVATIALSAAFETQMSAQAASQSFGAAGLSSSQLANLSRTLGVDFTQGGAVTSLMGNTTGSLQQPAGAPSSEVLAGAINAITKSLDDLKNIQTQLTNNMIAAYNAGNVALGNQLYGQLQTVNGEIKTQESILASIGTNTQATANATVAAAATTQQMGQALLNAAGALSAAKDQAAALQNQLIEAEAAGNNVLVTSLTAQLSTVNGTISSQSSLLSAITAAVQATAPDIVSAFSLMQSALAGTMTQPIADAIATLKDALSSGDSAVIAAATQGLKDAMGPTNDALGKIPAGFKASSDDIVAAIGKQQDVVSGLLGQQSDLKNAIAEAVLAGNGTLVTTLEGELSKVNSQLGTANQTLSELQSITAATQPVLAQTFSGFSGIQASTEHVAQAIANEQAAIAGLNAHLSDLKAQLTDAVAAGNGSLATFLNGLISQTNSDLNTANGILNQIQVNTGAANDLLASTFTGQATAGQTADAIANLNKTLSDEQAQMNGLIEELKIALASGDTAQADKIQSAITTLQGYMTANNNLLKEIGGSADAAAAAMADITGAVALSADQIAAAIKNANTDIASLKQHLSDLNTQLVAAEAANNKDLVKTIQQQISQTNSELQGANGLLTQLNQILAPAPAAQSVDTRNMLAWVGKQIEDNAAMIAEAIKSNNQPFADAVAATNRTLAAVEGLLTNPPAGPTEAYTAALNQIEQDTLSMMAAQRAGNYDLANTFSTKIDQEIAALGKIQTGPNSIESQMSALNKVVEQTKAAADAAQDTPTKIHQLQNEMNADNALSILAAQSGNQKQADAYAAEAAKIKAAIDALQAPLGQIAANTGDIAAFGRGSGGAPGQGITPPDGGVGSATGGTKPTHAGFGKVAEAELAGPLPKAPTSATGPITVTLDTPSMAPIVTALTNLSPLVPASQTQTGILGGPLLDAANTTAAATLNIPAGFQATAEQLTAAIAAQQAAIATLQAQAHDLNQALIAAVATGDTAQQSAIQTAIQTVNSQLSNAQSTLTAIQGSVAATAAVVPTVAAGFKASTDQIAGAIANEQGIIAGLLAKQADLQQGIIAAVASGDTTLVATLQSQLSTVSGQLGTANSTLSQIQALTAASAPGAPTVSLGATATADQMAAAAANAQAAVDRIKAHLSDLQQALIIAEAAQNDGLVAVIEAQISTTNSQLSTANGLLSQVAVSVPAAAGAIADSTALTAAAIQTAIANEQTAITELQTKLTQLNTQLVNAIASGDQTLITTIQAQISQTNSQLSAANSTLAQIRTFTGQTAASGGAGGAGASGGAPGASSPANPYGSGGYGYIAPSGTVTPSNSTTTPPNNLFGGQYWTQGIGVQSIDPNAAANHQAAIDALSKLIPGYLGGGGGVGVSVPFDPNQGSVPSYDLGGLVPYDMVARIHQNELIIPADVVSAMANARIPTLPFIPGPANMRSYATVSNVSNGGGVTINAPIAIYGATDAPTLGRSLMDYFRTASFKFQSQT